MTTDDVREDTSARPRAGFSGPDAPLEEDIYKCVHCGFCLEACPTYLETGLEAESPRGRIALMRAVHEGRAEINEQIVSHWDLCLQCRACEVACPSGVPYGRMMEATRSQVEQVMRRGFKERTARRLGFHSILPDNRKLDLAGKVLKLYQRAGFQSLARRSGVLKFVPGGSLERNLPKLSDKFFAAQGQVIRARGERRARVTMLAGCVMRLTHADTLDAVTRVLSRNGVEVYVPEGQGCCGALNAHSGERESARQMARRNIDAFLAVETDAIVVASAGCGSTMKDYGELLRNDPEYAEKAEEVASLTKDIHEFLVDLPFEPPKGSIKAKVTYQDSCHLSMAQRITEPPRQVLRSIPGVELVEMQEAKVCCGSAGTYSLIEQHMALRLGDRKAKQIADTGAGYAVTANPGCVIQMEQAVERNGGSAEVRYIVELLDEAYRMEDAG